MPPRPKLLWRCSLTAIVEWGPKQLKSEGNIAIKEVEMELENLKKLNDPVLAVGARER
jgi:hypothetical protein